MLKMENILGTEPDLKMSVVCPGDQTVDVPVKGELGCVGPVSNPLADLFKALYQVD
jgi:hypothetical protein